MNPKLMQALIGMVQSGKADKIQKIIRIGSLAIVIAFIMILGLVEWLIPYGSTAIKAAILVVFFIGAMVVRSIILGRLAPIFQMLSMVGNGGSMMASMMAGMMQQQKK